MDLPVPVASIRQVECVRIKDPGDSHRWETVPGATIGGWAGEEAARVVGLVAGLPAGELMRCFVPAYGIRAYGTRGLAFEIAFCFRCHAALVLVPGADERRAVGFDADSPVARDLLERFRSCGDPGDVLSRDQA